MEASIKQDHVTQADLSFTDSRAWHRQIQGSLRAGSGQLDVMAEFSKWLEAGEESIFSLETEKNLPGASSELPEAARPELKNSRK